MGKSKSTIPVTLDTTELNAQLNALASRMEAALVKAASGKGGASSKFAQQIDAQHAKLVASIKALATFNERTVGRLNTLRERHLAAARKERQAILKAARVKNSSVAREMAIDRSILAAKRSYLASIQAAAKATRPIAAATAPIAAATAPTAAPTAAAPGVPAPAAAAVTPIPASQIAPAVKAANMAASSVSGVVSKEMAKVVVDATKGTTIQQAKDRGDILARALAQQLGVPTTVVQKIPVQPEAIEGLRKAGIPVEGGMTTVQTTAEGPQQAAIREAAQQEKIAQEREALAKKQTEANRKAVAAERRAFEADLVRAQRVARREFREGGKEFGVSRMEREQRQRIAAEDKAQADRRQAQERAMSERDKLDKEYWADFGNAQKQAQRQFRQTGTPMGMSRMEQEQREARREENKRRDERKKRRQQQVSQQQKWEDSYWADFDRGQREAVRQAGGRRAVGQMRPQEFYDELRVQDQNVVPPGDQPIGTHYINPLQGRQIPVGQSRNEREQARRRQEQDRREAQQQKDQARQQKERQARDRSRQQQRNAYFQDLEQANRQAQIAAFQQLQRQQTASQQRTWWQRRTGQGQQPLNPQQQALMQQLGQNPNVQQAILRQQRQQRQQQAAMMAGMGGNRGGRGPTTGMGGGGMGGGNFSNMMMGIAGAGTGLLMPTSGFSLLTAGFASMSGPQYGVIAAYAVMTRALYDGKKALDRFQDSLADSAIAINAVSEGFKRANRVMEARWLTQGVLATEQRADRMRVWDEVVRKNIISMATLNEAWGQFRLDLTMLGAGIADLILNDLGGPAGLLSGGFSAAGGMLGAPLPPPLGQYLSALGQGYGMSLYGRGQASLAERLPAIQEARRNLMREDFQSQIVAPEDFYNKIATAMLSSRRDEQKEMKKVLDKQLDELEKIAKIAAEELAERKKESTRVPLAGSETKGIDGRPKYR